MSYTYTDKVKFAYTNNFDAFGRLRVSQPFTLFDSAIIRFESFEKTLLRLASSEPFFLFIFDHLLCPDISK